MSTTGPDKTAAAIDPAEGSRRLLEDPFNTGNFEVVDQLISPEAINHDPAQPARMRHMRGPELVKQTVQLYRNAFPDVNMTAEDVITAGDKVVLRWRAEGTHRGELEGMAPTGAHVSVTGISIDQWRDGKVVETWTQWDNLGMARQLGAAPPEGGMGEKVGIAVQRLAARRLRKKHGA
jgi:steroid delta-isomerase-like uncharacterized protein